MYEYNVFQLTSASATFAEVLRLDDIATAAGLVVQRAPAGVRSSIRATDRARSACHGARRGRAGHTLRPACRCVHQALLARTTRNVRARCCGCTYQQSSKHITL